MTTKEYARNVMAIKPNWLTEVAPNFFFKVDAKKIGRRKREETLQPSTTNIENQTRGG